MAKVLLVEDDNNLREIYQARLSAEGYDLSAAQNGEEALVIAKQTKPDLIISDVMMPRISGFEMLDILRNTDELKNTKVIMLTALGQAEDQSRADSLGADKYLVKSQVTLEDIVNAAKELLGETTAASTPAVSPETPAPASTAAEPEPAPAVVPEPVPTVQETPVAVEPAPAPAPAPSTEPAASPVADAVATPASVVPQPDTTVVVPPAPANPTPPTVTVTPMPPAPAPMPEPAVEQPAAATPAPAPAPAAASPVSPSDAADATNASQSLEAEEATVQAQIDTFASQAPTTAPQEAAPAGVPAATPQAAVPSSVPAANDAALASAVDQLNAGNTPADTNAAPSSAAPAAATESVGGTKVIQPLSDAAANGPDINELLAREEAKEAGNQPATTPAQPSTPQTPGADPNSIAL